MNKNNTNAPFSKLRKIIKSNGYSLRSFSSCAKIAPSVFNSKMTAHYSFTQDEMYDIMDALKIDYSEMHEYFPPRTAEQRAWKRRRRYLERQNTQQ